MADTSQITLVQDAPNPALVIADQPNQQIVGSLVRRTIFDLSTEELERLKLVSQMYAASTFNNGNTKQSQGDFFLIMMKGLELGIAPMAAVDTISIIQGKPTLDAKGMLALVKSSGLLDFIDIDSTKERCIVTVKRKDNPEQIISFTIEEARQFKTYNKGKWIPLADKPNWQSMPEVMLKWRAVTKAMREVFPDILSGLYTQEELAPDHTVVQDDGSMHLSRQPLQLQQADPEKGQQPEEEDDDKQWYQEPSAISKVVTWSRDKGYGNNEAELLNLLEAKNWEDFNDGRDACTAIKVAHEALEAELASRQEPTWTLDDKEQLSAHLRRWFDKSLSDVIAEIPEDEFPHDVAVHFANADEAIATINQVATQHQWHLIVTQFKVVKAQNGCNLIFDTPVGKVMCFSRKKFAGFVGEEFETMNEIDIATLEPGDYETSHICLAWKQFKVNKTVTSAVAFDPYTAIPI